MYSLQIWIVEKKKKKLKWCLIKVQLVNYDNKSFFIFFFWNFIVPFKQLFSNFKILPIWWMISSTKKKKAVVFFSSYNIGYSFVFLLSKAKTISKKKGKKKQPNKNLKKRKGMTDFFVSVLLKLFNKRKTKDTNNVNCFCCIFFN